MIGNVELATVELFEDNWCRHFLQGFLVIVGGSKEYLWVKVLVKDPTRWFLYSRKCRNQERSHDGETLRYDWTLFAVVFFAISTWRSVVFAGKPISTSGRATVLLPCPICDAPLRPAEFNNRSQAHWKPIDSVDSTFHAGSLKWRVQSSSIQIEHSSQDKRLFYDCPLNINYLILTRNVVKTFQSLSTKCTSPWLLTSRPERNSGLQSFPTENWNRC